MKNIKNECCKLPFSRRSGIILERRILYYILIFNLIKFAGTKDRVFFFHMINSTKYIYEVYELK